MRHTPRLFVPLVTPFVADLSVDHPRLVAYARRILAAGVRGEIPQARLEMHDESGTYLETRAPDLTLRVIGADATGELEVPVELSETDEADVDGPRCLIAEGDGVRAVVARLT